ncbi:branched-chain amino acid ABC transporter permease [Virgibacillus byunsanensis]|uniref:Branched-chain amino acid ABC transporter permease n=1 Tax=Virgibacillus byunsanensis TaxID=570945 RepID=A0ABW3LJI1_9BACI
MLLQVITNSIMLGFVLVIVALGLSLIFGILDIVNFAHGGLLISGGYLTYVSWSIIGGHPFFSIIPAMLMLTVIGILLYYCYLRFIPADDSVRQILGLIGFNIVMENLILMIFGSESISMNNESVYIHVGSLVIYKSYLIAAVLSLIMVAITFFILYRTTLGTKIRAVADNPIASGMVGINRSFIYLVALCIGFALTGAAGGIISTYYTLTPAGGLPFVILAFTAVVLGGLGNLFGTIVGAFIVSFVQNFTAVYLAPELEFVMLFLVFMTVVVLRPQGLMGGRA